MKKIAKRDQKRLRREDQRRVINRLKELAVDPRSPGVERLSGSPNLWRVRIGDYRAIYTIQDDVLLVLVLRIGHRREVYKLALPSLEITAEEEGGGEVGNGPASPVR